MKRHSNEFRAFWQSRHFAYLLKSQPLKDQVTIILTVNAVRAHYTRT